MSNTFCFLLEAAESRCCLRIEPGRPAHLGIGPTGSWQLQERREPTPAGGTPSRPPGGGAEAAPRPGLWLEVVGHGREQALLAVPEGAGSDRPRRGGRPLPPVAVLAVGDVLSLADGSLVHVTAHRSAHVGPPPAAVVGQACPLCRAPIEADARVYLCPCGEALHSETEAQGREPLPCTDLAPECPQCARPVELTSGYEHVPEAWHGQL